MKNIISLILICFLLTGCMGVFVTGAAVGATATALVNDQRPLKIIRRDQNISGRIEKTIAQQPWAKTGTSLSAATFNGFVLLVGQVKTQSQRQIAGRLAKHTPGVRRVINEITIGPVLSTLQRAKDTWITTKVRTSLLTTRGLESMQIKVVTENRIVYLLGKIKSSQAKLATETTRKVSGVRKVVKIFEYT